ncbi:MAG: hypothetical protein HY064_02000 [Bacteroidetes bacterium]|nr:hypothetical protein [Bacteroidota bacterium]
MFKRFSSVIFLTIVFTALEFSCSDTANNGNAGSDTTAIDLNKNVVSAQNVFYYVPSPVEMASLLKTAGAKYNKNFLNDPMNAPKYSTTSSRALNLGVYGTDLAFAGIFDEHAETMLYMNCTGKIADALHVSSAFDNDRHSRLENNMNNRDSVLSIITDTYWDCDALFRENHQDEASSLMLAGGWIEGLYLACKVAEETNSNDIRIRIVEQRSALDKLIVVLDKENNSDVKSIDDQLKSLKKYFDALPKTADGPVKNSTDTLSGVTTVGDDTQKQVSLNDLEFNNILALTTSIRNSVVNQN